MRTGSNQGSSGPVRSSGRAAWWLLVAGLLLLSLNLRPAVTSPPPIFDDIQLEAGVGPVAISVLATVPLICFGLFGAVAAALARRFGEERVLLAAIVALALGLALRAAWPAAGLFPGTIIACGAIGLLNVLITSLIKRRTAKPAILLAGYLVMLYIGAITSSAVSVPLYRAAGGTVGWALGLWAIPAALAVVVWLPQWRYRTEPDSPDAPPRVAVQRHGLAWLVSGFMGLQSLLYYATLSFLPTIFRDRGMSAGDAGLMLSVMSLGGLVTAAAAPLVVRRYRHRGGLLVIVSMAGTFLGIGGVLIVPLGTIAALMVLLGLGQGASLALALGFIIDRAATPVVAASLSSLAQSVGYLVAAAGPLLVGLLHDALGSWPIPIVVLLVITVVATALGVGAAQDRTIG